LWNIIRDRLKEYIDTNYGNWDLTIALRYLPIVEDIRRSYQQGENILEVGSEIQGITPYLKMQVTGVDLDFDLTKKNQYLTPVKGSALDLPFKDSSFDYVLSVDMLEHIPEAKRKKAVEEMVRVTRKKIYLSFPCGLVAEKADISLHKYYLEKRGEAYPFLKEHVELGLPDCHQVYEWLSSIKGNDLRVFGNTSLWLWVMLLKFGLSGEKFKSSLYRRLLLLLPILKYFNFGSTYRKLFILKKSR